MNSEARSAVRGAQALLALLIVASAGSAWAQPVLTPPVLVEFVEAEYPQAALDAGVSDVVEATLFIDAEGRVARVELLTPAANAGLGLDEAALAAMQGFVFEPARRDGEAIPAKIVYSYRFDLPAPVEPDPIVEEDPVEPPVEEPLVEEPLVEEPLVEANVVVEGVVRERGTREPMPGVLVSFELGEELFEVYTDEQGRFLLEGLTPGEWEVLIKERDYDGYQTKEALAANERLEVVYYIEREYYDAYGAESAYVYETRERQVKREVTRRTLTVTEIQKIPGNQGDALKVVQNLPGVARSSFNSGALVVRGSAPEDTTVLLDGAEIPLLYHFGGLTSVVNTDIISNIDFIPGNFSTRYGRAMGGVLDVSTRRPRQDRLSGYVDIDVIDTALFLEGPLTEDISFQASARRSYFDAIIPFVVPDDIGGELTVAPRYWDYQGRVNVMLGGGHELEAFAYGSDDVLEFIFSSPQANNPFLRGSAAASTSFHRGQLTWNYRSDTFRNRLVYNFGSTVLDFGVGDSLRFLLDILQHTVREEARFELDDRLAVVMGMDMVFGTAEVTARLPRQRQDGEFAGGFDTLEYLELGVEQGYYQPAAFMEVELDVLEELLLVLGGRFDYARELGSFTGDLRSSLRWTIDKNFSVTGGVGRFSQAPEFQATAEDFGNPDLDWQHAVHYALGGSARAPFYEPLTLEITGFYKSLNDLVAPSTDTVIRNGRIEPERFANTGEGRVYGAELLLRHELANNFFGWIAYTVSRAERNDQPGEEMELFEFDQTHILTALASYKLPAQWQIGLRFRYVTGRPFTPQEGAVFDADADAYQPLFGVPGSQRVEAFHQLDLRVDKSWVFDWWILSAYLDIQGVYFHANPEFIQYNFDSTQQGYVRGLPILPSIGIKGEF